MSGPHARRLRGRRFGPDLRGIQYPEALHNPAADLGWSGISEQLLPEGRERSVTLQKHKDDQDRTIGGEWIYSDDDGEEYRVNTQTVSMDCTRYGSRGNKLAMPEYA
ncbi:hypothetical protein VB773_09165 [Haloarculaceae archaeon H-GB2-1]|nr:hypothetical protein [Haloarculaceae archaeon H-GB1-1]MEA5386217.1 hypothetical protein [Haloarculaceae archaeon H-GB11]MEA5407720.1 hypothetical protein [Haloarculaceae archaeon H-GB2-1]